MPDQTRNLNSVTDFSGTLDSNDRIIMTDNKASLKALTTAILGNAMVEGYTGSSLAGANQSIKSAVDTLNSKINNPVINTVEALNTYLTNLPSNARVIITVGSTVTNALVAKSTASNAIASKMDTAIADLLLFSLAGDYIGTIRYNFSSSTVTKTIEVAKKSDVDELNSKLTKIINSSRTAHSLTVANSSRHYIIATGGSAQGYWIGYIYVSGSGSLTIVEVAKGSNVSSVTSNSANTLTITFASSLELRLTDIVINGDPMTIAS